MLPFKPGIFRLARARPDIELVPVWLANLNRVLPKGQFVPVPLLCAVTFGTPMKLGADETRDAFLTRAREALLALPQCIVGLEVCLSAHFVSRCLRQLGFEARIIPAKYTKPSVKGQKNDYNDAEGIAEAALRPNLKLVGEKSQDQLDLQALHRVRSRLVSRRTATINQIRAFLIEQGITVRTGAHALRTSLFAILQNREDELSPRMIDLTVGLYEDWLWLDERIETITGEIELVSERDGD